MYYREGKLSLSMQWDVFLHRIIPPRSEKCAVMFAAYQREISIGLNGEGLEIIGEKFLFRTRDDHIADQEASLTNDFRGGIDRCLDVGDAPGE